MPSRTFLSSPKLNGMTSPLAIQSSQGSCRWHTSSPPWQVGGCHLGRRDLRVVAARRHHAGHEGVQQGGAGAERVAAGGRGEPRTARWTAFRPRTLQALGMSHGIRRHVFSGVPCVVATRSCHILVDNRKQSRLKSPRTVVLDRISMFKKGLTQSCPVLRPRHKKTPYNLRGRPQPCRRPS